jgi:ParB-like chromosome segregation protein Spo0J
MKSQPQSATAMPKSKDGPMNKPQPKLEQIHPADLIPYARNAKKHDPEQVAKIAGSIREFGFNNPVLIDQDNGIIAGHGRVMAAIKLGLESVPVIRLSHLSETQRRAYILADNKLAELGGGWDEEMLKVELEAIKESDLDHLLTGFSDEEMVTLIGDTEDASEDDDGDSKEFTDQYAVTVVCNNEEHQRELFERLMSEGLNCKIVCV